MEMIYEFVFVNEKGKTMKKEFYSKTFGEAWHDAICYGLCTYGTGLDKVFLCKVYEV